ncbi:RNA-dependent RNA polymerase [Wenzhou narna-like virus 5]|uniref:RNA-dependent RNA polymerase n=1 Tax=Wenzhou narna-like virus 5 TaxID=1923580 RepID=UPI00090BF115|nr:RNA-dependent RNA polymerase [Wenzhou narna-like virus 5]APG77273.1 RNA-dependent RNA polymerase [Wenzhou narna-like virus 5]
MSPLEEKSSQKRIRIKTHEFTSCGSTRSFDSGKSLRAFGSKGAASMSRAKCRDSEKSKISVHTTILSVLNKVQTNNTEVNVILESLLWPFVARRSQRSEMFSPKEFDRMVSSFKKTGETILKYVSADNKEQKFCKYWLDYYMCLVFQDHQRPEKPEWLNSNLFSGWLKRFVCRAIAKDDVSFIYSLQKGSKRLWPRLSKQSEYDAYLKHASRLSSFHGFLPDDLDEEISRTSQEIFLPINSGKMEASKYCPTGSGCLQATKNEFGALSLLPTHFEVSDDIPNASSLGKLRALNHSFIKYRQESYDQMLSKVHKSLVDAESIFDLKCVAVAEPSKFRMITKGDGYLYTALQPLQGQMLDCWKKSKYSTMLEQDFEKRIQTIDKNCRILEFWCSVDYEAATDLIKKQATLTAIKEIDHKYSELAFLALSASGQCQYPQLKGFPKIEDITCIDSQLMGHPLSFPLLCTINLAVFRCALKRWVNDSPNSFEKRCRKERAELMYNNVLVNGDDMLFKCERSFYEIFVKTALDCGLKMSQGKQYLSVDHCMINSLVFKRVGNLMRNQGYLNLKVISNESLKDGVSLCLPTQISKTINEMCSLVPWACCIIPTVFKRWSSDLKFLNFSPNWFLPCHLGGFGVERRFGSVFKLTRQQRKVCTMFVKNPELSLYFTKGFSLDHFYKFKSQISGALSHPRFKQSYCPLNDNECSDDPWLERISLIHRFSSFALRKNEVAKLREFGKELYRFRTMPREKVDTLVHLKFVSIKGPICPPLPPLKLRTLNSHIESSEFP